MRAIVYGILSLFLSGASISVAAQPASTPSSPLAACGDEKISFNVDRGKVGALAPLVPGKAALYIVEFFDLRDKGKINRPTIRQGLDGAWIGATQGFTYVTASIDPGEHHLCSRWQSHFGQLSDQISLNNFDAVAGKTYYFRVQINVQGGDPPGPFSIDLQSVSEDEGRFLVSEEAQSISKPKK